MPLTYRTAGAWGAGKGSNLTPAEVDANFWQLVADIEAAAEAAGEPNGIANITQDGSQITIVLDDATELGPFTLPRPTQRPTQTQAWSATTLDLTLAHVNYYFRCSSLTGTDINVPTNASVAFLTDTEIHFRQLNDEAPLIFVPASGVTINVPLGYSLGTALQGAVVTLKKVAENEWDLFGLLAPEEVTA